ncbi:gem-associated protein 8-like [Penaeus japonicus]|uniref:gem-associated protein 8-like n=1 Tax=Penaeus japonicus TaxID=27405 RepID=UPI001C70CC61|nr:gem-associated protein 8-like [Penaeus japonicus]
MYSDSQDEKSSEDAWYYDKRYARFWHHYNTMMMTAHRDAVVRARHIASHTNTALSGMLRELSYQEFPKYREFPRHKTSASSKSLTDGSRTNRNRRKRKRKKRNKLQRAQALQESQGTMSDSEALQSQMSQGMHLQDEEEENMEVSEDFLEFIQQSEKHRVEWKTRKVKKALEEEKQSEDSESSSKLKEHPDVVRSREMHLLYGEASARIHAMETAIQLSFDRISTLYQPQYWPNIPLKLIF